MISAPLFEILGWFLLAGLAVIGAIVLLSVLFIVLFIRLPSEVAPLHNVEPIVPATCELCDNPFVFTRHARRDQPGKPIRLCSMHMIEDGELDRAVRERSGS